MSAGNGPGPITADGCAVDVYAAMQAGPEPDLISSAVPAGASILELGCGAGRVTNVLTSRGFRVTGVDESAAMLAHVQGAETVQAKIEDLDLRRRFDAVLLCSHLVNAPIAQREQFVASCARHVAADGCVVIERHDPAWFDTVSEQVSEREGITFRLYDVSRPGPGSLAATVAYTSATGPGRSRSWQRWSTMRRSRPCSTEMGWSWTAISTRIGRGSAPYPESEGDMTWTAPQVDRSDPVLIADERAMLESWLEFHRATLLTKCAGMSVEQLRMRTVEPSSLSLLGLVRHMTEVERSWFRRRIDGEDIGFVYVKDVDEDADFNGVDHADAQADLAAYHAELDVVREVASRHSLDDTFVHPRADGKISVRWVYVHMIEEYARHNGHADLLRERIDGATGD